MIMRGESMPQEKKNRTSNVPVGMGKEKFGAAINGTYTAGASYMMCYEC